ncbi:MAG TPA: hypothetical protein VMF32_20500 [Xanthobacteraceae bacterium]|nr:hypothetical protein [Xanthobacteraceae bacterium]
MSDLLDFLSDQLADNETGWSLGSFGVIAEFTRDADEAAALDRSDDMISVATARGGIRIQTHAGLRPIATESPTSESWSHRVALCLAQEICAMNVRTVLTEVGLDRDALRTDDREAVLFDLGLGALQVDACVRSGDPEVIAALRGCAGKSVFAPGNAAMSVILAANPHRVFVSRIGRIEVFQPIPPPGDKSPEGPHTHVLPKLLAHGRTHAATEPLPAGWIPCAHFYPPHPLRDGLGQRRPFQRKHHAAFQALLDEFGEPHLVEIKRRVTQSVMAGDEPSAISVTGNRFARNAVRVALRQLREFDKSSEALAAWLSAHDRFESAEAAESVEGNH